MDSFIVARAEERAKLWADAKGVAEAAATEKRELSAEEKTAFDKHMAEIDRIDAELKELTSRAEAAKAADEARARYAAVKPAAKKADADESEESELRAVLTGARKAATFVRTVTTGNIPNPTSVYGSVIGVLTAANPLVDGRYVTVLNTANGNPISVATGTALSTAGIVGEGSPITPSDPTMGSKSLGAFKYATLIPVSNELLTDAAFNASAYVADQAGRAIGLAFGAHELTGNGTTEPAGAIADATVGSTAAAVNYEALVDLVYSVAAPYRASGRAAFVMNDATIAAARKMVDGNGAYVWSASAVAGQPDTLLGFPVLSAASMPNVEDGEFPVLFGDLSRLFVRLAGGVEIATDASVGFASDLTYVRAILRADSVLTDSEAVKKLEIAIGS